MPSEFCPASFGVLSCSVVVGADTHLKQLDRVVSGAHFLTGVCLSETFLIVDLWQYRVCCIRSGVSDAPDQVYGALPVPYVPVRAARGARVAHRYIYEPPRWLQILAVCLFLSQCPCGTILLTLCSIMYAWQVSRSEPMLFYWPLLLEPLLASAVFPFLFCLSIGWYCGEGVFRLIGCRSLSPSLALPTSFNNNNYKS